MGDPLPSSLGISCLSRGRESRAPGFLEERDLPLTINGVAVPCPHPLPPRMASPGFGGQRGQLGRLTSLSAHSNRNDCHLLSTYYAPGAVLSTMVL